MHYIQSAFRVAVGVLFLLMFSGAAVAADFLPAARNNTWTLKNPYTSVPITLKMISDEMVGSTRRVELNIATEWGTYSYQLIVKSDGIQLEGIRYPEGSFRYPDAVALFPWSAAANQTFVSPYVRITLVSAAQTVVTSAGTRTGCRQYRITWPDGHSEDWLLAPNLGFVQYGTGTGAYKLQSYSLNQHFAPAPVPVQYGKCPRVGIDPNESAVGDHSPAGIEAAVQSVTQSGSRSLQIEAFWTELEVSKGTYDFNRVAAAVALAKKNGLVPFFTLRAVDTQEVNLPADLADKSLNDPAVLSRLTALLSELMTRFGTDVPYFHIGNEIDTYFAPDMSGLAGFQTFYQTAAAVIKSRYPAASVGTVFGYSSTKGDDRVFRMVLPWMDHVAFTYYPINEAGGQRAPGVPAIDLPDMLWLAGKKQVILTEIGYASAAAVGGSAQKQADFYTAMFNALAKTSGRVAVANFFLYSDPAASVVAEISSALGLPVDSPFGSWFGSLGVRDQSGKPKTAWGVFANRAQMLLSSPVSCTLP